MIKYKLTNQKMQTHDGFQWELGEWVEATGDINQQLCSDAWLHCYDSSLLAVLHNPMHAEIDNPRLFEVEVGGESKDDNGMKCGYRHMRMVKEIPIPTITTEQRIKYAILCAKKVCKDKQWNEWADKWLSGEDRSQEAAARAAARAAAQAAQAAQAAAWVAAQAAAQAAQAAAQAAAWVAAQAAQAAAWVAAQAAQAAEEVEIDLVKLAEEAVQTCK